MKTETPRRSRWNSLAVAALAAALAACGGSGSSPSVAPTEATTVPASMPATSVPLATVAAASTAASAAPLLTGDAATNESCALLDLAEITAAVDANVVEIKGLTQPGAYAPTMLSCAWYLDAKEIGIPSVVVQWEFPVDQWHDSVVALYGMMVEQDVATDLPNTGDAAILQGSTAEAVAPGRIVRVSVLLHPEPTADDVAAATALLKVLLERTEP